MEETSDSSVRRRQLLQALGIAGAAGLAGCSVSTGGSGSGSNNSNGSSGSGNNSSGGSSTKMASSADGWAWNVAAKSLTLAADPYNKKHKAKISINELGKDTWRQRFQTAIASGSGAPDFSTVQNYDVSSFADKNGLTDLTDRIKEAGIPDKIVSGKLSAAQYNGKYYAFPWDVGPTGVFYTRDLYKKAGIDPSSIETWDDFIEEGKKLENDTAMVNIPHEEISQLWRMLYRQLGGQAFTKKGAVNIGSEKSVRVADLVLKMKKAGITTRIKMWSSGWFTSFSNGQLASLPTAVWMDGTLREELPDTAGNWGVYKLPAFDKGGTRVSNRGGSDMVIPSQISDDARVNRAYNYIEYAMTTPKIQNKMLTKYGIFPSLKSAYKSDLYDKKLDFYDGQPIFRLFADVATDIKPYRYTADASEVNDAINTEFGRMLDGKKSPKQTVTDAAQTVANRTNRKIA